VCVCACVCLGFSLKERIETVLHHIFRNFYSYLVD